jgi:hypothetical protein
LVRQHAAFFSACGVPINLQPREIIMSKSPLAPSPILTDDDVDWESKIRDLIIWAAGEIPEIGEVLSKIIEVFWPEKKQDIWDSLKDRIEALIDDKIRQKEIEQMLADISGIRKSLDDIKDVTRPDKEEEERERCRQLDNLVKAAFNPLSERLLQSSNAIYIMPIVVTFAHIHLRSLFQIWHYDDTHPDALVGLTPRDRLIQQWKDYTTFLADTYPKWKEWRMGKITVQNTSFYDYHIKDWITNEEVELCYKWQLESDVPAGALEDDDDDDDIKAIRERIGNDAVLPMAKTMALANYLVTHLPPDEQSKHPGPVVADLRSFWLGPYSLIALVGAYTNEVPNLVPNVSDEPKPDEVLSMAEIWPSDTIDGLRLTYSADGSSTRGHLVGDPARTSTEPKKELDGSTGKDYFCGLRLRFSGTQMDKSDGHLASIQFFRASSEPSPIYGNETQEYTHVVDAVPGGGYRLKRCQYAEGRGQGDRPGIKVVKCEFEYIFDVRPS